MTSLQRNLHQRIMGSFRYFLLRQTKWLFLFANEQLWWIFKSGWSAFLSITENMTKAVWVHTMQKLLKCFKQLFKSSFYGTNYSFYFSWKLLGLTSRTFLILVNKRLVWDFTTVSSNSIFSTSRNCRLSSWIWWSTL